MTHPESPEVYMLCGPAGSGKTTHAANLVAAGAVRLSIDEDMAQFGQPYIDYDPVQDYRKYELEVLAEHRNRMLGLLASGTSVVLDYGFPSRSERDEYKELIEAQGIRWRLLYFAVPFDELRQRIKERNTRGDANAQPITEELLHTLVDNFEVPDGEGEELVEVFSTTAEPGT